MWSGAEEYIYKDPLTLTPPLTLLCNHYQAYQSTSPVTFMQFPVAKRSYFFLSPSSNSHTHHHLFLLICVHFDISFNIFFTFHCLTPRRQDKGHLLEEVDILIHTVGIRVESTLENTLFIVELGHIFLIFSLSVYSLENVGNIDLKILGDRQNIPVGNCHDFHCFPPFSTLSPRRSHSFRSTMTCFSYSYLILSFFPFILSSQGHTIKIVNSALFRRAIYSSGLSHKSR